MSKHHEPPAVKYKRKGEVRAIWKNNDLIQIEMWMKDNEELQDGNKAVVLGNKQTPDHPPEVAMEMFLRFLLQYCNETGYDFRNILDKTIDSFLDAELDLEEDEDE